MLQVQRDFVRPRTEWRKKKTSSRRIKRNRSEESSLWALKSVQGGLMQHKSTNSCHSSQSANWLNKYVVTIVFPLSNTKCVSVLSGSCLLSTGFVATSHRHWVSSKWFLGVIVSVSVVTTDSSGDGYRLGIVLHTSKRCVHARNTNWNQVVDLRRCGQYRTQWLQTPLCCSYRCGRV